MWVKEGARARRADGGAPARRSRAGGHARRRGGDATPAAGRKVAKHRAQAQQTLEGQVGLGECHGPQKSELLVRGRGCSSNTETAGWLLEGSSVHSVGGAEPGWKPLNSRLLTPCPLPCTSNVRRKLIISKPETLSAPKPSPPPALLTLTAVHPWPTSRPWGPPRCPPQPLSASHSHVHLKNCPPASRPPLTSLLGHHSQRDPVSPYPVSLPPEHLPSHPLLPFLAAP